MKKMISLFLALLMLCALAGCSGNNNGTAATPAPTQEAVATPGTLPSVEPTVAPAVQPTDMATPEPTAVAPTVNE